MGLAAVVGLSATLGTASVGHGVKASDTHTVSGAGDEVTVTLIPEVHTVTRPASPPARDEHRPSKVGPEGSPPADESHTARNVALGASGFMLVVAALVWCFL